MINPFRRQEPINYTNLVTNHTLCMHLCIEYLKDYAEDLSEDPTARGTNLATELQQYAGPLPAGHQPGGIAWLRWFLQKKVPERLQKEKDVSER